MIKAKNISEIIQAIEQGTIGDEDKYDRYQMVEVPIKEEVLCNHINMIGRRFYALKRILFAIPGINNILINRVFLDKIEWINSIFPAKKCIDYIVATKKQILENREKYEAAYALLDAESRETFIGLICFRLSGDFRYLIPHITWGTQYQSNKISWKKRPNIVDCGGFIGDTLVEFVESGIIPNEYYIYEMDSHNYNQIRKVIKTAQDKGVMVTARNSGVYSATKTRYYLSDRDSSRIVDYKTDTQVNVVSLDNDLKMVPDFIKMDIEGSEVDAVHGAEGIIKKYSPILAICIYHLDDDFWRIPLLIKEINPLYTHFWIEHYQMGYNETVLYVSR